MSKYKKYDLFIISIDKIFTDDEGNTRYKIKGFNTLMFDDNGLDKLLKNDNSVYDEGYKQAVEDIFTIIDYCNIANKYNLSKIIIDKNKFTNKLYSNDLLKDIDIEYIKTDANDIRLIRKNNHLDTIVTNNTKLVIGDEIFIENKDGNHRGKRAIVLDYNPVNKDILYLDSEYHTGTIILEADKKEYYIEKTGRHFDNINEAMLSLKDSI